MHGKQREMPFLAEIKPPRHLTQEELAIIHDEHEAMLFCVIRGRYSLRQKELSEQLGIHASHLSQMKTGAKHWPLRLIDQIQELTGLLAFDDYRDKKRGKVVLEEDVAEKVRQAFKGAA